MAVNSADDQALALKKRARRRLVGAIALVLLMLIILPNVLKDRAQVEHRAPIALTMPEAPQVTPVPEQATDNPVVEQMAMPQQVAPVENIATTEPPVEASPTPPPPPKEVPKLDHESEKSSPPTPKLETAKTVAKPVEAKASRFLIQVGVFSDADNVKKLQAKIAEAGFTSRTAKLMTPKGEKIRLRVGSFVTRDAAAEALKKMEAHGLSGMVLTEE